MFRLVVVGHGSVDLVIGQILLTPPQILVDLLIDIVIIL